MAIIQFAGNGNEINPAPSKDPDWNSEANVNPLTLEYKPDFQRAAEYWDALWHHEIIDRPCTLVTAPLTDSPINAPRLVAVDDDFSQAVERGLQCLASHAFLGEALPAFRPGFGPDQMAAFLGAPLSLSDDENPTSWSHKIVEDWRETLPLRIDPENTYFKRMKEFHALASEKLHGRGLLSEIDMHTGVDLLEGLRGAQKLLFDMIDEPELMLEVMADARKLFRQVYETFYDYGNKAELGTLGGLPLYDRGKFNRIQADFIALMNPEMFRTFALPAIEDEADYLDRSGFHLDGPDALVHLDDLLAVEAIDAIQWVSGAGNKPQLEWPEVLHKIQDAGKIILLHLTVEDVKRIHGEYKPELLVYDVRAKTPEEGDRLLDWLKDHT